MILLVHGDLALEDPGPEIDGELSIISSAATRPLPSGFYLEQALPR